jgi:thiamine pyrophosphokinase
VTVVRGEQTLTGAVGDLVSLIPMGGPASGVTTQGLRFPLDGETLDPLSGRGVSNTIVAVPAVVTVASGVLLAIRPLSP